MELVCRICFCCIELDFLVFTSIQLQLFDLFCYIKRVGRREPVWLMAIGGFPLLSADIVWLSPYILATKWLLQGTTLEVSSQTG